MAARTGAVLVAAALAALGVASCTLDREGTGELAAGTGGSFDASVGGSAGTTELGGSGGSSTGGTAGTGASSGSGGTTDGGTGAMGGSAGAAGQGGSSTGGTGVDGGGTGGSSTGGTEAGTGDAGVETNCLNGVDDDGDGDIDCADEDCEALYECVAAPPADWEGIYRVRELPWADPAPAIEPCPDGAAAQRFYQDAAGALSCVCGCGSLTGASCSPAHIACSTNKTCGSPADWTSSVSDGSCHKPNIGNSNSLSCKLLDTGTATNAGSCPPTLTKSGQDPFARFVDVCGPASGAEGCFSGYACTEKAGGSYASPPCVMKVGNVPCPPGWGTRHLGFRSYTDTRNCSACSCAPQVVCGGTAYAVFDDNSCSTGGTFISDTTCKDASGALDYSTWSIKLTTGASATGQCAASGGASTGTLTTADPVTICCQ